MSFLFPSFLWGLVAIAIPIAIHLFNFRRAKKVYFSNVAFLRSVEIQTSSFRRLKHLLIMAARILMISCLVFAFAQPFIPAKNESGFSANGTTSLYLDNSFSMQNEHNNERYLDAAVNRLNEVLGLLRNSGNIQLLTNNFGSDEQSFLSADRIRDRLTMIETSPVSRTLDQIFRRQMKALENENSRSLKQLFWVSDFQQSTAGDLMKVLPDSTVKLFLIPVQAQTEKNLYVDSVWLNTPFLREFQNNILHVKVKNSGSAAVHNQAIKLNIGGEQISSASVNIDVNSHATASFNFSVKGQGIQKGHITFEDYPITFDNDYYFVLNASPKINIFHLTEDLPLHGPVGNVFDNDSIFQVSRMSIRNLDLGLLNNADLIVMEGIDKPAGSVGASLQTFIREGGSLMVIPPVNPDLGQYNTWLNENGLQLSESGIGGGTLRLKTPDRNIPFFSDVFEASVQNENLTDMPAVQPVWHWNKAGIPLLFTQDEFPFLSRITQGQGDLFLLGAPLHSEFGNFAQHALFVPVMYKIAAMSVRAAKLAYSFNDPVVELETAMKPGSNTIFRLRKGDMEIIPVQRLAGNKLLMELPGNEHLPEGSVLEPGFYDILSDEHAAHTIALNYNKAESELEFYSPEDLRKQWEGASNVYVFDTVDGSDFMRGFERQHLGISLWKYLLMAALFFLLVEVMLIRFVK